MLKSKVKQVVVNSDSLFKMSIRLLDQYTIEPNIYSLLLLSYLTVKEYSRYHAHLDKHAKTDLCLQYLPDLVFALAQAHIIDNNVHEACIMKLHHMIDELKEALETYNVLFAYKNDHAISKAHKWFGKK